MPKKAIIIGSGIGGLATAARLLSNGFDVTILEKNSYIGGKTSLYSYKNFKFDLTASILMFPKDYIELFKYCNENYKNYFKLIPLNPVYKVFYSDNTNYNFYTDVPRLVSTLESFNSTDLIPSYLNFLSSNYKKYEFVDSLFLNNALKLNNLDIFQNTFKNYSLSFNPFLSCSSEIKNYSFPEKLQNYLLFQSMYIGASPYKTSNFYNIIPSISQTQGLYHIEGGIYSYILSLKKLIEKNNVAIKVNNPVNKILFQNNKAIGVEVNGEKIFSDLVICSADYHYCLNNLISNPIAKTLIPENNNIKQSCSIFIIHLALDKKYNNLNIHNIFINENFKQNITDLFNNTTSSSPSLYIYCPSKIDKTICPEDNEILSIYIRVPNLHCCRSNWCDSNIDDFSNEILNILTSINGLEDLHYHIIHKYYVTPLTMLYDYNSPLGSAFGLSHTTDQSLFFRPQHKIDNIENLYFVGASTHPGNGVAMVLKSSKICVDNILKTFNSPI